MYFVLRNVFFVVKVSVDMVNKVNNFIFKLVYNVLYKMFCIELVFVLKFVFEVLKF